MSSSHDQQVAVEHLHVGDLGRHVQFHTRGGRAWSGDLVRVEHGTDDEGAYTRVTLRQGHVTRHAVVRHDQGPTLAVVRTSGDAMADKVLAVCDQRRIFTADLAGGYRAEGWRWAMDAVRAAVAEHTGGDA